LFLPGEVINIDGTSKQMLGGCRLFFLALCPQVFLFEFHFLPQVKWSTSAHQCQSWDAGWLQVDSFSTKQGKAKMTINLCVGSI